MIALDELAKRSQEYDELFVNGQISLEQHQQKCYEILQYAYGRLAYKARHYRRRGTIDWSKFGF